METRIDLLPRQRASSVGVLYHGHPGAGGPQPDARGVQSPSLGLSPQREIERAFVPQKPYEIGQGVFLAASLPPRNDAARSARDCFFAGPENSCRKATIFWSGIFFGTNIFLYHALAHPRQAAPISAPRGADTEPLSNRLGLYAISTCAPAPYPASTHRWPVEGARVRRGRISREFGLYMRKKAFSVRGPFFESASRLGSLHGCQQSQRRVVAANF